VPTPSLISATDTYDSTGTFGPFLIGGNLYVVLVDVGAPSPIHCYESTDGGSTWNIIDSVGSPNTYSTANVSACAGAGLIYVVFDDATRTDNWIAIFQPGTGWIHTINTSNTATTGSSNLYIAIRPSDGNAIVAGNIKTGASTNQSAYYIFNTSSLTATVWNLCGAGSTSGSPTRIFGILQGASGTTWFLMNQTTASNTNVAIQSLSSADSLGSIVTVATNPHLSVNVAMFGFSDGTTMAIAYSYTSGTVEVYIAPTSTMVFVTQPVTVPSGTNQFGPVVSATLGIILFASSNGSDNVFYFVSSGGSFGPQVTILTGDVANDILGNTLGPGGWSIIFVDTNGVEYLVGLAPPPAISSTSVLGINNIAVFQGSGQSCRFDRPTKPAQGSHQIVIGKNQTYPVGYVH
jgi:hypothetical protein